MISPHAMLSPLTTPKEDTGICEFNASDSNSLLKVFETETTILAGASANKQASSEPISDTVSYTHLTLPTTPYV